MKIKKLKYAFHRIIYQSYWTISDRKGKIKNKQLISRANGENKELLK